MAIPFDECQEDNAYFHVNEHDRGSGFRVRGDRMKSLFFSTCAYDLNNWTLKVSTAPTLPHLHISKWWYQSNQGSGTLSHRVCVMCNMLCFCALAPCLAPLFLCWSDIETGCLSLDHRQLHLSQLATTGFAFLMSTSISQFRNTAHASVSNWQCVCVCVNVSMWKWCQNRGGKEGSSFWHPLFLTDTRAAPQTQPHKYIHKTCACKGVITCVDSLWNRSTCRCSC